EAPMSCSRKTRFAAFVGVAGVVGALVASGIASAQTVEAAHARSKTDASRVTAIGEILNRWQPVVARIGMDAVLWREQFATQLGLMSDATVRSLLSLETQGPVGD